MTTDDFFWRVAFDALRAEVPVGHVALDIEHVDSIVCDALHKEPELLFAELEHPFGLPALGEIARDLGVADDVAGRGADRINNDGRPELAAILANAPAF